MFIFGCPMRLNPHKTPQSQKIAAFALIAVDMVVRWRVIFFAIDSGS
jgi:hypothetical protein